MQAAEFAQKDFDLVDYVIVVAECVAEYLDGVRDARLFAFGKPDGRCGWIGFLEYVGDRCWLNIRSFKKAYLIYLQFNEKNYIKLFKVLFIRYFFVTR